MNRKVTDINSWMKYSDPNTVYGYLVYKRMFTPYEQKQEFVDESQYEGTHYTMCQIEEAIDMNGDWLLGLRTVGDDGTVYKMVHYYRLSEIRLAKFDEDQELQLHEEERDDLDEEDDLEWLEV